MLGHACGKQDDANSQGDEQAARLWIIHVPTCLWLYLGPTLDSTVELR